MRWFYALNAGVLSLALTGCISTKHPQSAAEFRQALPGSSNGAVEKYIVYRSLAQVTSAFKKNASKCLNVSIKTTSRTNMSNQVIVTNYKPTVVASKIKVELHVQQHHSQGVTKISEEPDGGYYLLVADAIKIAKKKTRLTVYRPRMGFDVLANAVRSWASGTNMGCPDMTKI